MTQELREQAAAATGTTDSQNEAPPPRSGGPVIPGFHGIGPSADDSIAETPLANNTADDADARASLVTNSESGSEVRASQVSSRDNDSVHILVPPPCVNH